MITVTAHNSRTTITLQSNKLEDILSDLSEFNLTTTDKSFIDRVAMSGAKMTTLESTYTDIAESYGAKLDEVLYIIHRTEDREYMFTKIEPKSVVYAMLNKKLS